MSVTRGRTPLEVQLAEIAVQRVFRRGERDLVKGPLTAIFADVLSTLDTRQRRAVARNVRNVQLRPFRAPPELLEWILRQIGREGLMRWVIAKLPRSDQAAAERIIAEWSRAGPVDDTRRRLLEAATRFGLNRATRRDESLMARSFAQIAKEKAMATTFDFDARGLPAGFDGAAWNSAVDALLQNTFGLPKTGNEKVYAAIKGIVLLNDQFDPASITFLDSMRQAWDEVIVQKETFVTRTTKDSNRKAFEKVADTIPAISGRPPDDSENNVVFFQELASVGRFVIGKSADVPLDDANFNTQVRIGLDQYVGSAPVFESLELPPLGDDTQIVPDNVRAVGTLSATYYLEKIRIIDVVDRITEVFNNGALSVGFDSAGRALHDYYWSREDRLRPIERMSVYSRVLGVAGGDVSKEVQPNREFEPLLNRFIASVAEYDRQRSVSGMFQNNNARPLTFLGEHVRKAGNDLARNTTLYGYGGAQFAARMIAETVQSAIRILSLPAILRAYGVQSPYQVIERVAQNDFNQQVNVVKYKTMAEAAKEIHDIIARNAALWSSTLGIPLFTEVVNGATVRGQLPEADQSRLFTHAQFWLAVNGVADQQVEKLSQPVESKAGPSLPLLHAAGGGAGLDAIAKLQQMVSSGSTPSLDQLKTLLPVGNA